VRRVGLFAVLLVLAACGGGGAGFYDDDAKDVAKRAAMGRLQPKRTKISAESAHERSKCPQAPSPKAGPCVNVELRAEGEARPVTGGPSIGTVKETIDAFVWLARKGGRWSVTYATYRPREVSVNGMPYSPSN
jgi:hypothetical protein